MDSSEYAIRVFDHHASKMGSREQLRGKTILELGPGDSIASAILSAAYGARAILVDMGRYVRTDLSTYVKLEESLTKNGWHPPNLAGCKNVDDILRRCNASYMTDGVKSLRQIQIGSVDCIFSHAVLEHVRKHEFLQTMQECRRILKSNGVCSHQVDLRDHLDGALNNLRFSERIWESELFVTSGFYTNRIRYGQMSEFFREAGFEVQIDKLERWNVPPILRNWLASEFKDLTDEELRVSGFSVVLWPKKR